MATFEINYHYQQIIKTNQPVISQIKCIQCQSRLIEWIRVYSNKMNAQDNYMFQCLCCEKIWWLF